MNHPRIDQLGRLSAFVVPAVAFVAIFGAALLAPEFSWRADALSDLGAPGAETAWLFNGGLICAGVLGVPFAASLASSARTRFDRLTAVVLVLTLALLSGVGLFPTGHPLHLPVAAGFISSRRSPSGSRARRMSLWVNPDSVSRWSGSPTSISSSGSRGQRVSGWDRASRSPNSSARRSFQCGCSHAGENLFVLNTMDEHEWHAT